MLRVTLCHGGCGCKSGSPEHKNVLKYKCISTLISTRFALSPSTKTVQEHPRTYKCLRTGHETGIWPS